MKTFFFDVINGEQHRVFTVRAVNLEKAFDLSKFQMVVGESLHQVCTSKKGYKLPQPVWDYIGGDMENKKVLLDVLKE